MNSKEISRESKRIFELNLLPNWLLRSQEDQEDYGIDGEIEVTDSRDRATGLIFKVQLKGIERANFDGAGQLIFSSASVDRFKYYTEKLEIPTLFIACDLSTRSCYWVRIQGNRTVEEGLSEAFEKGQKTFTLKFPAGNQWSRGEASVKAIIDAVGASSDSITIRRITTVSVQSLREDAPDARSAEKLESHFRRLAGLAANEKIQRLLQMGKYESAFNEADSIFKDEKERKIATFQLFREKWGKWIVEA